MGTSMLFNKKELKGIISKYLFYILPIWSI